MKILRTGVFKEDYKKLPIPVQEKFDEKIKLFIHDIRHPSLRVKKMKGHKDRWRRALICSIDLPSSFIRIIASSDASARMTTS